MDDSGNIIKTGDIDWGRVNTFDLIGGIYFNFNTLLCSLFGYSLAEFLIKEHIVKIRRCINCKLFYIAKTKGISKYCSQKCHDQYHNRKNIESGKSAAYKKRKYDEPR